MIRTPQELDAAWLSGALAGAPVSDFELEQIGTGQMSESHRVTLTYVEPRQGDPSSVVLKLASGDRSSRATGVGLGIYEREVRFYRELAPRLRGPLAACHLAAYEQKEGWFTLLFEDVTPAVAGDQIAGCGIDEARLAMRELATLHAPVLEDRALEKSGWLNRDSPVNEGLVAALLPGLFERYGEHIASEHRALCERFAERADAWLGTRNRPLGLVHGDFRLDNLLFGLQGSARVLTVVDWQTVSWGGAMADAAYFLSGALDPQLRRMHERELFGEYHEALCSHSGQALDAEQCWTEYRRAAFAGVLMAIIAPMLVQRTKRGDEMFMAMLARHSQQALDLDAEALLGEAAPAAVPVPVAADEAAHEPGAEQLWNESWYFDAVAPDGSLGAYVRVGLYPNLATCWYTAFACGPGRPTLAAVDFAASLPAPDSLEVRTPVLHAEHRCGEPLQRFAVTLRASAQAYGHSAALMRGERGEDAPLALALEWETAGVPYGYRLATRYEIPCRVHGWIELGGERLELSGARGQRDHSWGVRDWWSMDWMWSALALEDDTRVHAVQLRLPGAPPLSVGYVQPPSGELVELKHVRAEEQVREDGLIERAELELAPPGLRLEVQPLAFGPLRLLAPDGRVSHFPRAMCRVRADDGREGVGWMEWNLNQPARRG